ncbi:hypothetical protein Pfo_016425, partial [Paulownia fortunei]
IIGIGVPHLTRDQLDSVEVGVGGGGEPGLNYVDAEASELSGDVELLFDGHGGTRGLLSVAKGGVEYADVLGVRNVVRGVLRAAEGAADGDGGRGTSEVE